MDENFLHKQLESYRVEIDQMNEQLLQLFNQRADLVLKIGKLKQQMQVPYRDIPREKEILKRLQQQNKGPLSEEEVQKIFQILFEIALNLQQKQESEE